MRIRAISAVEEQLLLEFAKYLQRDLSAASVAAYQSDVRIFAESNRHLDLSQITDAQEDAYIGQLTLAGTKPNTVRRKSGAFRHFREFLNATGRTRTDARAEQRQSDAPPILTYDRVEWLGRSNKPLDQTLYRFFRYVRAQSSDSTLRAYSSDLLKFRMFLPDSIDVRAIAAVEIMTFLSKEEEAGLRANSIARLLASIRAWFRWMATNYIVKIDVAANLRVPRAATKVETPSADQLTEVSIESSFPQRDRLLFELLYRCGVSVSEIFKLNVDCVDLPNNRLFIAGRRGRARRVELSETAVRALADYLQYRKRMPRADLKALVLNQSGTRLTTRSVGRIIKALAVNNQLPAHVHPNTLRHAFAAHSVAVGEDIQKVRHNLGVAGSSAAIRVASRARRTALVNP